MTKLIASLAALAVIAMALPAMADCPAHQQQTVQSAPVVTSDATTPPPQAPVPPKSTKTGS
jgi:hypothetical protein